MVWGAVAAAGLAPIVGGLVGEEKARADKKRAEQYYKDAAGLYDNVETPDYANIDPAILEEYGYAGDFTHTDLGPSSFDSISLDPATRNAQMEALQYLQNLGNEGGLNAMDKAKLAETQSAIGQQERGSRDAISQNMMQRGISGSGLELLNQNMNQQAAAQRASSEGLNINAMAQQRALDAMMNAGQLGGQIRGQDYGMEKDKASAADAIARYNNQGLNSANQGNLGNRQTWMNSNTDIRNQNKNNVVEAGRYGNTTAGQTFNDGMAVRAGQAQGMNSLGGFYGNQAQDTRNTYAGIGKGAGEAASTYAMYDAKDPNKKKGY